ncbi:Leucine Rich repeats (2 copies) [Gimesia panareensis]|nr:Leucine Rich repeats (2 copies) [Gimesia panareensis]
MMSAFSMNYLHILFLVFSICLSGCGEPPRTVTDETAAYWVLSKNGSVSIFLDGRMKHARKLKQLPVDHFAIRAIRLNGIEEIPAEGMREISGLRQLRDLNLSQSGLNDQGLLQLTNLPQLRNLNLSETDVSDESLQAIGQFPQLRTLNLATTKVTGTGLEDLVGCGKLTELNLSGTSLRPESLNLLKPFTNLIKLDVSNTFVSEKDLGELKQTLKYCEIKTEPDQPNNPKK